MVYYRKYRPQTIAELDSAKLRETLYAVLGREEIPHAFLLTGPKGLGKTSTARIIAKVVNCTHSEKTGNGKPKAEKKELLSTDHSLLPAAIEPDNTCEQCVSITNGSNLDVLEIDGASNRGIDEIRDLRDKVKLAPSKAKKKVYIIDEVHMLTSEAFNALLKTIEEPPSHVLFLFCTTEPHKVPATILSRCFHVGYTLATEDDLVRSFKRIVGGENITIDEDALHAIARLAEGGFRDGTKVLEEMVALANGERITAQLVEEKYHTMDTQSHVMRFLQGLKEKNIKESIEIVQTLVQQGIDMKHFIAQLLEALHEAMLHKVGISPIVQKDTAPNFSMSDIQDLASLFSEAYQQVKYAVLPQLPVELAVIAWCHTTGQGQEMRGEEEKGSISLQKVVSQANKYTMDTLLKKEKNLKVQALLRGSAASPGASEAVGDDVRDEAVEKSAQEEITDKASGERFMENLIYKVKSFNFSVAGVLRGCSLVKLADGEVIFSTSYKFHKERLDEGKTREIIEKAIKEITGKSLKVMVELKG